MGTKIKLCALGEVPRENSVSEMTADGRKLCVANVGGKLHAMENDCPHRLGPLGEGTVEDGLVLCPWHAWGFNPATGECRESPQAKVKTYVVEVAGEDVMVELE